MDEMLHSALDRMVVRDICDLACVPSVFECLETDAKGNLIGNFDSGFKVNRKYIRGRKKADRMFNEIMASPERIKHAVDGYLADAKRRRKAELEAELESLNSDE